MHRSISIRALVDSDAYWWTSGGDGRIINETGMQDDVDGIDSHQIKDIPIVTGVGGLLGMTNYCHYADIGTSKHSTG